MSSKSSIIQESVEDFQQEGMVSQLAVDSRLHVIGEFDNDYEWTAEKCGNGYSGPVRLCRRKIDASSDDGPLRCAKRLRKRKCGRDDNEAEDEVKNEVTIHLTLDHPNIAKLLDVYEDDIFVMMVTEYCTGGTVEEKIFLEKSRGGVLGELTSKRFALQILLAIGYVHHKKVAHRDVKPANLLLSSDSNDAATLKLIDFGFSATCPDLDTGDMLSGCVGTAEYTAPEVVASVEDDALWYSEQCDLWSVGATLYYMLSGTKWKSGAEYVGDGGEETPMEVTFDAEQCSSISEDARDLVRQLLVVDQDERLTASQALQHRWLSEELDQRRKLSTEQDAIGGAVLESFRAFAKASCLMRSSLQTVSYSKPAKELEKLERLFCVFDQKGIGEIDVDDFRVGMQKLHLDLSKDRSEALFEQLRAPVDRDDPTHIHMLKYSEFIAALLPMTMASSANVVDAFINADEPRSPGFQRQFSNDSQASYDTPLQPRRLKPFCRRSIEPLRLEWDRPLTSLEEFLPPNYTGSFDGSSSVLDLIKQMTDLHYRSAVICTKAVDGDSFEFFDIMDVNRMLLSKLPLDDLVDTHQVESALTAIASIPCSSVANASTRSVFVPTPVDATLRQVCETILRSDVRRVPLTDGDGSMRRVFSAADFLALALRIPQWTAVLKTQSASVFENRENIDSVCVSHDETMLSALRKMDASKLTICPVINVELSSCDAEGAVAMGVVSVTDLKHIILSGDGAMLSMSVLDFIAWRNTKGRTRNSNKSRFPYVSGRKDCSLHTLSKKLLATNLQRIFISSEKLSRVIGVVSARDILKQAWPKLRETEYTAPVEFSEKQSPALAPIADSPFLRKRKSGSCSELEFPGNRRVSWADQEGGVLVS